MKKFQLTVPFMSDHDGVKSSRLDLYSRLGVVAVPFQTAPLEAFVISHKWYRKLAVRGFFQWQRRPVHLAGAKVEARVVLWSYVD